MPRFPPLVAEAGFEPATSGLWVRRAAELLYSASCSRGVPGMVPPAGFEPASLA